ncbi:MAG: nucleotide disphospho-sugar-binding domain-containing protein [Planctomycetota bacterium]
MARYAITALGSAGDVYPFLAIGRALQARGHEVVMYASAYFEERIENAGLTFGGGTSKEEFERLLHDPRLWHPTQAFGFVMEHGMVPHLEWLFESMRAEARRGDTVLVASTLDFASRIVRDLEPVKLATLHLAPVALRSHKVLPRLGTRKAPPLPGFLKSGLWWLVDRAFDPHFVPAINRVRAQHGLEPIARPMHGWWHSPDLVLGLFPDWFAGVPSDWPPQLELTGFVRYDSRTALDDPELEAWLEAGDPPILFTAGSANVQGHDLFAGAVEACRRLDARGLLVTLDPASVPANLPDTILHRSYVPFGAVLPHTAALVAHGGIGTCAQGLAAGVPHLVVSMAHDQFDNAGHLEALGVGKQLTRKRFTGARAAAALETLLSSPDVARACLQNKERMVEGTEAAVDALERLARK